MLSKNFRKKLNLDQIIEGAERSMFGTDNVGFCTECGAEAEIEPDAENVLCDACGLPAVYGAEQLLLYIA